MANRKIVIEAKSAVDEDSRKAGNIKEHTLEFEVDVSEDVVLQAAGRQWVIDWQRRFRANPTDYPEGKVEIKVSDLKTRRVGTVVTEETAGAFLRKVTEGMSEEEKEAYIASLMEK